MKQILFFFLIFLSNVLIAQNLSMSQLLEVKKKDLGNAEEYLTAKGWEFLDAEEPKNDKLGKATFTYNKSDMSSRAESFLTFLYSNYSDKTRISIQVNKKEKYNEYLAAIKAYGCKLLNSKVEDGSIVKIYRGATTTFEISASTSTNFYNEETAIWHIFIVSNDDYDLNWGQY